MTLIEIEYVFALSRQNKFMEKRWESRVGLVANIVRSIYSTGSFSVSHSSYTIVFMKEITNLKICICAMFAIHDNSM